MPKHIYNYNTHAEKRYFLGPEHHGLYDIIRLNGNIVSHTPEGVAGFLATAGKDFYIDPQTHAFQHATIHLKSDVSDKKKKEPPRYKFKPSIVKLANERLGGPFSQVIANDKPISPAVFTDKGTIKNVAINSVCQSVKEFQLDLIESELDDEAKEFIEGPSGFKPVFVIAPYFYLSKHSWREWLEINVACYQRMKELVEDVPTYLSLVVSKDALDNEGDIVSAISGVKPDGILLWIDSHVEEELRRSEVESYVHFLKELNGNTEFLYNSHGGYLSILLCHPELGGILDGVAHSVNYGEHRNVVPIGGGLPMARFYLYSLHSRLRWGDAADIVQPRGWLDSVGSYRENICMCHQCQELFDEKGSAEKAFDLYGKSNPVTITRRDGTIVRLEYPTKEAKQAATRHYLYNKAKEFDDVETKTYNELLQDLDAIYREVSENSGEEVVSHLRTWYEALRETRDC